MDDTQKIGIDNIKIEVEKPTEEETKNVQREYNNDIPISQNENDRENSVEHLILCEEVEDIKANRELRDKYSFKAFKVVKKSLWGWAILLFIYGLVKFLTRHDNGGFEIFSDHVLIAITSATTLNIFAGFLSLIRGLFPSIKEDSKAKQLSPSVQIYCKTPKKNTY
ncbi:hypothetical protein [Snodgrassella communis]|uniref:hypothetical protein n=1 Tax=Snodgrassella communis TaxID=2946699 RepID=UPI001EF6CA8F|nr:hypothetical protein [Snodgrassella communis]